VPTTAPAAKTGGLTKLTILEGGRVIGWAPAQLASDKGFFRDEGLDVEYITSAQGATTAVAAVVGGSAFMAFTGAPVATSAVGQGSPVRIVLVASNQYGVEVTLSNKVMQERGVTPQSPMDKRVQALKGTKVGIYTPGDSTDQLLRVLFRTYEVNADSEVELISTQNAANMLAAFQRGAIDGMAVSPPTGQQAESQGIGKVYIKPSEVDEIKGYPYLVGSANVKDIQERPQLIKGTAKAVARAERMLRTDPAGAKPSIRKFFEGFDPTVFDLAYEAMLAAVPENPIPTRQGFEALEKFVKLQGKSLGVTFEQAMEPRPAEEAVKELG
jgi:NitT/TauT family transport system substrate-binding protein